LFHSKSLASDWRLSMTTYAGGMLHLAPAPALSALNPGSSESSDLGPRAPHGYLESRRLTIPFLASGLNLPPTGQRRVPA
jgi:hypothetical protein